MDGSVSINASTVREVTELSSTGDDRNPWISTDGLRMYFSRDLGPPSDGDIYFTSRASTAQPFATPTLVSNLSTNGQEGRVSLTPDELMLVISSQHGTSLNIDLATRNAGQGFGSPDGNHTGKVNMVGSLRFDPFLSVDGQRLYLVANSGSGGRTQLLMATRATGDPDFGSPVSVPVNNNSNAPNLANMGDPTLSRDERLIVFSAFPSGMGPGVNADLWYETRSSASGDFGTPTQIPGINTNADEFDPVLSADGCELYFASTRNGGKFHLFHAQVTK